MVCRTVGPSLAASLEPLAHCQNIASLSLFYRYYIGRCSSKLAKLAPIPYSWGRSTCYSNRLHDFSVAISRCYKDIYVKRFFPWSAILWNSLPIECFPLTCDPLTPFNCRFFLNRFPVQFNLFVLLFLLFLCLVVAIQPCIEWISSNCVWLKLIGLTKSVKKKTDKKIVVWKFLLPPNIRPLKLCLCGFIYKIKLLKFKYVHTFKLAFLLKKYFLLAD